jgi:hypothetical protein
MKIQNAQLTKDQDDIPFKKESENTAGLQNLSIDRASMYHETVFTIDTA